jgi:dephospho-CoA kinase
MKIIGITGGIGSGKSLVAKILHDTYGACLINTDQIAKEQMEPGGDSYGQVVAYFGKEILAEDHTIDRKKLAAIVFQDEDKRRKINQITHPIVLDEVQQKIRSLRQGGNTPYVIIETALMIESGYDSNCDEVWYVYAPEEDRRRRLKEERKLSDEKIDSILASQSSEEAFRKRFSKVIENTGDIEHLRKQVEKLINS